MKRIILPVAIAFSAFGASTAFGAALNRDGLVGVDKTFSAQTLHHGKLGIGVHTAISDDELQIENATINQNGVNHELQDYLTLNSSLFLSVGLGPYTDIGLSMPMYYEKFKSDVPGLTMDEQYPGDLRYRLKVQFPFKQMEVLDMAILLGGSV